MNTLIELQTSVTNHIILELFIELKLQFSSCFVQRILKVTRFYILGIRTQWIKTRLTWYFVTMTTILDTAHNLHLFFLNRVPKTQLICQWCNDRKSCYTSGSVINNYVWSLYSKKCPNHIVYNIYTLTKALLYKVQCFYSIMTHKQWTSQCWLTMTSMFTAS